MADILQTSISSTFSLMRIGFKQVARQSVKRHVKKNLLFLGLPYVDYYKEFSKLEWL